MKISQTKFEETIKEFETEEPRGGFYDRSLKLIEKGFRLEGALLLNATWNTATFRFHVSKFNVNEFEKTLSNVYPVLQEINESFEKADFKKLESKISQTYTPLSVIKGIDYTGATKLMHLFKPELFMPWDQFIREEYLGKMDKTSAKDYIDFLEKMQKKYGYLKAPEGKTLPKAIDEFNYLTISVPAVAGQNKLRETRKEKKKEEKRQFKLYLKNKNNFEELSRTMR